MPRNADKIKIFTANAPGEKGVAERLVDVVNGMWVSHGRSAMSARQIAQIAGTTTSLINYYFGGIEQLLLSAQAQSIGAAQTWCAAQKGALAGLPSLPSEATGHLMASLIDDLCTHQRAMVFAWTECQMLAARDPLFLTVAVEWRRVWKTFWDDFSEQMGLSGLGDLMCMFFDAEVSLNRIVWNGLFDRATLSETCVAWVRLLKTGQAGPMPLRDFARARAGQGMAPLLIAGTAERQIAEAAADIIGLQGGMAVTHRAVAQAAKVGLGSVTHHFPTSDALMNAAFECVYLRITQGVENVSAESPPLSGAEFAGSLVKFSIIPDPDGGLLAIEELIAAAGRDRDLAEFGGALRYTRGRSMLKSVSRLKSSKGIFGPSEAALMSSWAQGLGRDARCLPQEAREASVTAALRQLLTIIGVE